MGAGVALDAEQVARRPQLVADLLQQLRVDGDVVTFGDEHALFSFEPFAPGRRVP
jgi:hypothetical protein